MTHQKNAINIVPGGGVHQGYISQPVYSSIYLLTFSKNCLLLIHGFCSGPEDWEDQIKFFCADFTVLAPTLRGHDGNNYKNRPMSIEQLSNDCVKILNTKSFNKVVIAGHSMGTRLANLVPIL